MRVATSCFCFVSVVLTVSSGCTKRNPECVNFPDEPGCSPDAAPDAPPVCTTNAECTAPTGVCDVAGNACVQCLPDQLDACGVATPACGDDHTCVACRSHADCPATGVCLDDGSCAPDSTLIAYVAPTGSGTTCTKSFPCGTLEAAITTNRATIKVAAGQVTDQTLASFSARTVRLYADTGATITRSTTGPIVEIKGAGANVELDDIRLTGALPAGADSLSGHAIIMTHNNGVPRLTLNRVTLDVNQGCGIFGVVAQTTTGGQTILVNKSILANNTVAGICTSGPQSVAIRDTELSHNQYGSQFYANSSSAVSVSVVRSLVHDNSRVGIEVDGGPTVALSLVGNIIYDNGNLSNGGGGIVVFGDAATGVIEFNTLTRNIGTSTHACGLRCEVAGFTSKNNIIWNNFNGDDKLQVSGTCANAFSDIGPNFTATGSIVNVDPVFVDANAKNWHIASTSPVANLADPTTDLGGDASKDIDGDVGTAPAELGADELP